MRLVTSKGSPKSSVWKGTFTRRMGSPNNPRFLNGASDLLMEIFEARGRHTRTALGVHDMPLGAAVQLSFFAEVRD